MTLVSLWATWVCLSRLTLEGAGFRMRARTQRALAVMGCAGIGLGVVMQASVSHSMIPLL